MGHPIYFYVIVFALFCPFQKYITHYINMALLGTLGPIIRSILRRTQKYKNIQGVLLKKKSYLVIIFWTCKCKIFSRNILICKYRMSEFRCHCGVSRLVVNLETGGLQGTLLVFCKKNADVNGIFIACFLYLIS